MGDSYFGIEWGVGVDSDDSGEYAYIYSVSTVKMAVDIPTEVEVSGRTLPVKELRNFNSYSGGITINVHKDVTKISIESYAELSGINVAEEILTIDH